MPLNHQGIVQHINITTNNDAGPLTWKYVKYPNGK
jgi:hypothetical protein